MILLQLALALVLSMNAIDAWVSESWGWFSFCAGTAAVGWLGIACRIDMWRRKRADRRRR